MYVLYNLFLSVNIIFILNCLYVIVNLFFYVFRDQKTLNRAPATQKLLLLGATRQLGDLEKESVMEIGLTVANKPELEKVQLELEHPTVPVEVEERTIPTKLEIPKTSTDKMATTIKMAMKTTTRTKQMNLLKKKIRLKKRGMALWSVLPSVEVLPLLLKVNGFHLMLSWKRLILPSQNMFIWLPMPNLSSI
jgi:hypothetical protein